MKVALAFAFIVALAVSPAYADGNGECNEAETGVWVCPLPKQPPRCVVFNGHLVCTGPVVVTPRDPEKPRNCGWSRRHGYVCW